MKWITYKATITILLYILMEGIFHGARSAATWIYYMYHHTSRDSAQTVQAKQAFEAEAKRHGVTIKHYHADNGIFRTKPFEQDIEKKGQTLTFARVGT